MATRKNTLNFGDKSCRIIHGEKTTLRIVNILTREITICFKKSTQISKGLIIRPTENKNVISIQNMGGSVKTLRTSHMQNLLIIHKLRKTSSKNFLCKIEKQRRQRITLSNPSTTRKKTHQTAIYSDRKHSISENNTNLTDKRGVKTKACQN